ncbi:hypothetical protein BD770DRAFT_391421 [Pilaira anomala]|nr:hypothetical protein BD770DRAFT_391421 [Pilaira anomala]
MTQSSSTDNSDKKEEAAKFYSKWMKGDNKDENWDEVCLQWCKQQRAGRKDNLDPNCSMVCFKSPSANALDNQEKTTWNPLEGYSVILMKGKEECVTHVNEMKNMNESITTAPSTYTLDLGNIWNEASVGAKNVVDKNVVPLYNSTVEQATEWTKGPEVAQMKEFVKEKTDNLYRQIFQTSPPTTTSTTVKVEVKKE